jgi:DNA repair protein RadC
MTSNAANAAVTVVCEPAHIYGQYRGAISDDEVALIVEALRLLDTLLENRGAAVLDQPSAVKDYLKLKLALVECEVFGVVWLDSQNRVIRAEELFRGTVACAPVYPREVTKHALACNAHGAVLYHNHPSGLAEPSRADEHLTQRVKGALEMIDVRLLDHLIVGGATVVSFAERGLI